jgi:CHAT domain-containing protein
LAQPLAVQFTKSYIASSAAPAQAIDFYQLESAGYQKLLRIVSAPQLSPMDADATFGYADATNGDLGAEKTSTLRAALTKIQQYAAKPEDKRYASAWLKLLDVTGASDRTAVEKMTRSVKTPTSNVDVRTLDDYRSATSRLKALGSAVDAIVDANDRAFFKNQEALAAASLEAMAGGVQAISALVNRLDKQPVRTPRDAVVFLHAAQLYALSGRTSKTGAVTSIRLLQRAIAAAGIHWSRHPAITDCDATIVGIASEAELPSEATPSLQRLGADPDRFSVAATDPYQLSEDAFAVGGWEVARSWLLGGLTQEAQENGPTTSDAWAKLLRSRVESGLILSSTDAKINVLSVIVDSGILAPTDSPARRWALFSLAELYEGVGDQAAAVTLRKRARTLRVSDDDQKLIEGVTTAKAADDAVARLTGDNDLGLKAALYGRQVQSMADAGTLSSSNGLIAASILFKYYSQLGDNGVSGEIEDLISKVDAALQNEAPAKRSDGDDDMTARLSGVEILEEQIQEDGFIPQAQQLRLAKARALKAWVLNDAQEKYQSGLAPAEIIEKTLMRSKLLAGHTEPELVIDTVFRVFTPWIFYETGKLKPAHATVAQITEIMHGYGDIAALTGDEELAGRIDSSASPRAGDSMEQDVPIEQICLLLKLAVTPIASVAANKANQRAVSVIDDIDKLPCGESVKRESDGPLTEWSGEEARLIAIFNALSRNQSGLAGVLDPASDVPAESTTPDASSSEASILNEIKKLHETWEHEDRERVVSQIRELSETAMRNGGQKGLLSGAVLVVSAEFRLENDTVASTEPIVKEANKTALATYEGEATTLAGLRDELQLFNGLLARKREYLNAESGAVALAARLKARNDTEQLAMAYRKVLDLALEAEDYVAIRRVYFELDHLDIGFRAGNDAFLAQEGLSQFLQGLSDHCYLQSEYSLQPDKRMKIGECGRTVVGIAGEIAKAHLQSSYLTRKGESSDQPGPFYRSIDIMNDVAPFIKDLRADQIADVDQLLSWTIAERETAVDEAVARRQSERSYAPASSPARTEWRKAQALWRSASSNLGCVEADPDTGNADRIKFRAAEASARERVEKSLSDYLLQSGGATPEKVRGVRIEAVQERLHDDEAVLSYTLQDSNLLIWSIRKKGVSLRVIDATDIRWDIAQFYGDASRPQNEFSLGSARRLYELAVGPISDSLAQVHTLFIETDEQMSALPFPALVESPSPSPTWTVFSEWTPAWLVHHYAISLIPSLAAFATGAPQAERLPRPILAAGNPTFSSVAHDHRNVGPCAGAAEKDADFGPVPGAADELEEAIGLAGPNGGMLLDKDKFTEENLSRSDLEKFGVIVFATHGTAESTQQPARLILSRPEGSVAALTALTASDVKKFGLDADLVILSACDSGLTSTQSGLNELVPAFFAAGARHVTASAWPLDGTAAKTITSGLVRDYFAKASKSFSGSLQRVLLQMVNSPVGTAYRHPHFWAGIILLGVQ